MTISTARLQELRDGFDLGRIRADHSSEVTTLLTELLTRRINPGAPVRTVNAWEIVLDGMHKAGRELFIKLAADNGIISGPVRPHDVPGFWIVDTHLHSKVGHEKYPTIMIFRAADVTWLEPIPQEILDKEKQAGEGIVGLRPEDLAALGLDGIPGVPGPQNLDPRDVGGVVDEHPLVGNGG